MVLIMIDAATVNDGVLLASSKPKVPLISCYHEVRCATGEFTPCNPCSTSPDGSINETMTTTKAIDSPDELIRDVSVELFSISGRRWKHLLGQELKLDITAGDQRQLISTWSVTNYNLEWVCVLAVPRTEIFGTLDEGDEIMVTLCSVFCVVGVFLFIGISIFISRPLAQLSYRMFLVSEMQLDSYTRSPSCVSTGFIREFTLAEKSFQFMVNQLREYKAFIPANVLDDTEDSDDDMTRPLSVKITRESSSSVLSGDTRPSTERTSRSTLQIRPKSNVLKIGTLLHDQSVSVIATKLTLETGLDSCGITKALRDYVTIIHDIALRFRGSAEFADGSNMLITWGTVSRVASQELKASSAALEILGRSGSELQVVIGASCGISHTGAIGNEKMRKIVGVGSMYSEALKCRDLNDIYRTSNLVDERFYQLTKYEVNYSIVDVVKSNKKDNRRVHLYNASNRVTKDQNQEWMYEIQISEDNIGTDNHWKTYLSTAPPYDVIAQEIAGSSIPSLCRLSELLKDTDGRTHITSFGFSNREIKLRKEA